MFYSPVNPGAGQPPMMTTSLDPAADPQNQAMMQRMLAQALMQLSAQSRAGAGGGGAPQGLAAGLAQGIAPALGDYMQRQRIGNLGILMPQQAQGPSLFSRIGNFFSGPGSAGTQSDYSGGGSFFG